MGCYSLVCLVRTSLDLLSYRGNESFSCLQVYFSARPMRFKSKSIDWETSSSPSGDRNNIYKRQVISSLSEDGSVLFEDGVREERIDAVVFATGYHFSFPFLANSGVITVKDNR